MPRKDNQELKLIRKNILLKFEVFFREKGFDIDKENWFIKKIYKYKGNRKKANLRQRRWYKNHQEYYKNPRKRLDLNMSSMMRQVLKEKKMNRKWEKLVGYTLQDLIKYLENEFNENMSWDNWGKCWEIDHKIPKSWFNYKNSENPEFKKCWALENLQPLEKNKNRTKSNHFKS